jgi:alpha-beta hydrolase superfamily lysophospholipase
MNFDTKNNLAGYFEGVSDCKLYYKTWGHETSPKAVVAVVHGVGEHIDRYPHVVKALTESGYVMAGFDLRGHGRSDGQRGHILAWEDYRGDVGRFLNLVSSLKPNKPLFIYGHSLGSLIVLDYILHEAEGLRGAIISGTSLMPKDAAPPYQVLVARLLSGIRPKFSLRMALPGSSLARDPQVAKAYDEDPMVFWERSVRWGTESLQVVDWIKKHPHQVRIPVLFIHGEADPLVSVEGARRFYEQVTFPDKTLKVYAGSLHEPHNDLDHAQVTGDMINWLDAHLDIA